MKRRNKKKRNREERMKSKSPNNADGARDQGVLLIGWLSGSGKTPSRRSRDPLCPVIFRCDANHSRTITRSINDKNGLNQG